jgi:hypothetical protein
MAATPGFLIIDARSDGLPDAPGYYQAFPLEQSPLGEISLSGNRTTAMTNSSLDVALGEMLKAGAQAVVVLVCHAYSGGLLLPIATGGTSAFAVKDNLQIIDKVIAAESEVAQIRNLPSKTAPEQKVVLDRWEKLLNDPQPGTVQGQFTPPQAHALYAKWLDMVAKKLEFANRAALLRLIDRVRKVRNLKLSRLELRACNIGKDTASMEAVRKFFGVDHLTAPTVGTFFMSLIPVSTMAVRAAPRGRVAVRGNGQSGGAAGAGVRGTARTPGPLGRAQGMEIVAADGQPTLVLSPVPSDIDIVSEGTIMAQTGHTTRAFFKRSFMYFVGPLMGVHFSTFHMFALTVDETSAYHYRGSAAVFSTGDGVTQDWGKVREFVTGWIMPDAQYHHGPFPVAGLWTPDIKDVPFVLPYETMYIGLIAQSPP